MTDALETTNGSVDSGWLSRKLIVGVVVGIFVIALASFLMLVALTGILVQGTDAAALVAKFEPKYWLLGVISGLVFIASCIGLISLDKVLDLVRDALPVIKARYGAQK
jgi:hypothetical protein